MCSCQITLTHSQQQHQIIAMWQYIVANNTTLPGLESWRLQVMMIKSKPVWCFAFSESQNGSKWGNKKLTKSSCTYRSLNDFENFSNHFDIDFVLFFGGIWGIWSLPPAKHRAGQFNFYRIHVKLCLFINWCRKSSSKNGFVKPLFQGNFPWQSSQACVAQMLERKWYDPQRCGKKPSRSFWNDRWRDGDIFCWCCLAFSGGSRTKCPTTTKCPGSLDGSGEVATCPQAYEDMLFTYSWS